MTTLKSFFTGMVKDQEGNVSVQQIMGIIFAVILVVVGLVKIKHCSLCRWRHRWPGWIVGKPKFRKE